MSNEGGWMLGEDLRLVQEDVQELVEGLGAAAHNLRLDLMLIWADVRMLLSDLRVEALRVVDRELERLLVPTVFIVAAVLALGLGAFVSAWPAESPADGSATREPLHTGAGSLRPPGSPPAAVIIGDAMTPAPTLTPRPPKVGTGPAAALEETKPEATPATAALPTIGNSTNRLDTVETGTPGVWITEATFRAALAVSSWEPWNRERVVAIVFCESGDEAAGLIRLDTIGLAGEEGPMQILPAAHPEFAGLDLFDLATNLEAGHETFVAAGFDFWPWSCAG